MTGFKVAIAAALAVLLPGCGVFINPDRVIYVSPENWAACFPPLTPNVSIGLPKLLSDRPDYDFRWDLPDGYVVTDVKTTDSGLTVKIGKAVNPGPRQAYRIVLVEGGEAK